LLVGFAAGGPLDTSARLIAQWLSETLGQQFIVVNQPGAGTNLAAETVVRAPPDGYTLLEVSASNAWNVTLYDNLKFNFVRDIVPVAGVRHAGGVMEVHPSVPVTTVREFIGASLFCCSAARWPLGPSRHARSSPNACAASVCC
jgi:tripartite-type tricarboxylate transporter receptor subunit TctC